MYTIRLVVLGSTMLLCAANFAIQAQTFSGYGIEVFPHYSSRRLVAFDSSVIGLVDSLEDAEIPSPSYTAGLVLSYRGQKVGVQTGLQYAQVGYRSKKLPNPDPQSPFTDYRYQFLSRQIEIPFALLMYQNLSERSDFYFMMGAGIGYNIDNQDITIQYTGETSERSSAEPQEDFRKFNYNFQTAMGWEHRMGNRLVLNVAPCFRLWLGGLYREGFLNRNLYSLGFRVALRFDRPIIYEE